MAEYNESNTLSSTKTILARLRKSQCTIDLKRTIYRTRKFVAGDLSALRGEGVPVTKSDYNKERRENTEFPDFMRAGHEEGVSNHVYTWCRTLVMNVSTPKVSINCPDLHPDVSNVREDWLNDRLKKCDFMSIQGTFLFEYLTSGTAFIKLGLKNDLPAVTFTDILDMHWDIHAKYPSDYRFVAERITLPEEIARQELGDVEVDKIIGKVSDGIYEDCVPVIEYWDKNTKAYIDIALTRIIKIEKNPFGFIPYVCMQGPILPSNVLPVPHILGVIGIAAGHTYLQRSMLEIYKRMTPAILLNPDAFTPESYDQYQTNPEDLSVLVLKNNVAPTTMTHQVINMPQLTQEAIAMKKELEDEIIRALGVNPFMSGIAPKADFASQVAAVDSRSGLVAAHISNDLARVLSEVAKMMFKIGSIYDDEPFEVRLNNKIIKFDNVYSIKPLLVDEVQVEALPATYTTPAMKMQRSIALAQIVPSLAQFRRFDPKLGEYLLTQVLESYGVKDIDFLLEPMDEDQAKLQLLHDIPIQTIVNVMQLITQLQNGQGQPGQTQSGMAPQPEQMQGQLNQPPTIRSN